MCGPYKDRHTRGKTASGQRPSLAVLAADERIGLGGVPGGEPDGVPFELLAGAVGDVAEVVRLGEPARVFEVAQRGRAGLAGVDPLGPVAERLDQEGLGPLEVAEV